MSAAPFMQLYVADYLADTQHLTTEQHGAYLLLLMSMWRAGGSLPSDSKTLAKVAQMAHSRWHKLAPVLMPMFVEEDGRVTQKRLAKEHQKAVLKSQIRKQSGSLGGTAKALKDKEAVLAKATVLPQHSSDIRYQIDKRDTNVSPKKNGSRIPEGFICDEDVAVRIGLSRQQAVSEAAKFRDYWISVSGSKGIKQDWPATWRNWCRSAFERIPASKAKQSGPRGSDYFDLAAEYLQNEIGRNTSSNEGNRVDAPSLPKLAIRYDP